MDQQRPDRPGGPGLERDLGRISAFDEAPERRAGERDLPGMNTGPTRGEPEGRTMPAERATTSGRDGTGGGRARGEDLADEVQDRARSALEESKSRLADEVSRLGRALRDASQRLEGESRPMGSYARQAAEQIRRAGDYLRDAGTGEIVRDVQDFARRRPELFLGGLLVAGVLIGRFFRASGEYTDMDQDEGGAPRGTGREMGRDRMDQDRQPGGRAGPPGQTLGDDVARRLGEQAAGREERTAGDQGGPGNAPGTNDPRIGRRGFEGDSGGA